MSAETTVSIRATVSHDGVSVPTKDGGRNVGVHVAAEDESAVAHLAVGDKVILVVRRAS